ncbi:MAG: prephenate dehydrogenase [Calditrichaeota bacterium]|nr:prephenate dehydrogenase [Calditrichota bacterium]
MEALGIIGFGRFGQLLYQFLYQKYHVAIYDPHQQYRPEFENYPFSTLEEVCYNPLVIIATPISALDGLVRNIANLLKPETIVMDVCSVKNYPINLLLNFLPEDVEILGSHPLFGPESVRKSLKGHYVVLIPARISAGRYEQMKAFWRDLGVRPVEMEALEHDRIMAWTLALTHFLGRGLRELELPSTRVVTRDYKILKNLVEMVNRDTIQLFQDMHRFNPHTRKMRKAVLKQFRELDKTLDQLS